MARHAVIVDAVRTPGGKRNGGLGGWPESVPATTVDRQCGSSRHAAHLAAQGVLAGAYDATIIERL